MKNLEEISFVRAVITHCGNVAEDAKDRTRISTFGTATGFDRLPKKVDKTNSGACRCEATTLSQHGREVNTLMQDITLFSLIQRTV
jgi:hypothetical protein